MRGINNSSLCSSANLTKTQNMLRALPASPVDSGYQLMHSHDHNRSAVVNHLAAPSDFLAVPNAYASSPVQYEEFLRLSPKQQKKAGPWMGTGYWALEVAALSVLYDWDDTLLRESPNYPVDLVDCVRQ